jgi:phenylalanyl-tRNA synthetase beta chain
VRISEANACGQYFGRVIRGMNPKARTPDWMARRIERAGLRTIHPLVDITNYVMLERGQPMHAFDNAKLKGAIDVRFMKPGERIKLLNGDEVDYRPNLLAIADESGPVALGGVMGGFETMVGEGTTEAFFEAAFFHPSAVQGKARTLQLTSDAAHRFERGVDFGATAGALERATALALEICGGEAGPETRAMGALPARASVSVRPARARALLGYEVADREMHDILARLSCVPESDRDAIRVTPPSWRFDLAIEEDFVEEVARIHGYQHVPVRPPRSAVAMLHLREGERDRFAVRHALAAAGYQEAVNYSFVPEEWGARFRGQCESGARRQPDRERQGRHANDAPRRPGEDAARQPQPRRGPRACVRDRALLRGLRRRRGGAAGANRRARLRHAFSGAVGGGGAERRGGRFLRRQGRPGAPGGGGSGSFSGPPATRPAIPAAALR